MDTTENKNHVLQIETLARLSITKRWASGTMDAMSD